MTSSSYQVLARRYRPKKFSEVIGQEAAVTTLQNALRYQKTAHAYLFSGPRGIGKTTLARLFAKAINCHEKGENLEPCNTCVSCLEINSGQSLDVIEIDGASNRGIDDIRKINETALYSPAPGRYKIYLIDEVHMLTKEAFNALLKTLEEPPEQIKFFFATTEPHKIPPTILSRCQRFDLKRMPLFKIIEKLGQIGKDLGRDVEPAALHLVASLADGSLRDAESLFDQILCFKEETITASSIREAFGLIPQEIFFDLDIAFSERRISFAFELVEKLFIQGKDLAHFYEQLIDHVRNLSSLHLGQKTALPQDAESAKCYTASQCLYLFEYLLRSESSFQKSASQRASLEMILLHYIQSKERLPVEVLVQRLTALESRLKKEPVAQLPVSEKPKEFVLKEEKKSQEATIKSPSQPPLFAPPLLKPVPFNPFKIQTPPKELPPSSSLPQNDRTRHDILIRFAAVELEGTLKT